jgi:hypothetical protein
MVPGKNEKPTATPKEKLLLNMMDHYSTGKSRFLHWECKGAVLPTINN